MAMRNRIGVVLILLFAFFGLANAAYLSEHVASGTPVICTVAGLSDCNTVTQSQYSKVFGVPIAYLGVFYFGVLFFIAALELALFDRFLRRVLQVIAVVGVIASLGFVFVQDVLIQAFCIYCLMSAGLAALSFFAATSIEPLPKLRSAPRESEPRIHMPLRMPPLP